MVHVKGLKHDLSNNPVMRNYLPFTLFLSLVPSLSLTRIYSMQTSRTGIGSSSYRGVARPGKNSERIWCGEYVIIFCLGWTALLLCVAGYTDLRFLGIYRDSFRLAFPLPTGPVHYDIIYTIGFLPRGR